jgi:hypothetical protein
MIALSGRRIALAHDLNTYRSNSVLTALGSLTAEETRHNQQNGRDSHDYEC